MEVLENYEFLVSIYFTDSSLSRYIETLHKDPFSRYPLFWKNAGPKVESVQKFISNHCCDANGVIKVEFIDFWLGKIYFLYDLVVDRLNELEKKLETADTDVDEIDDENGSKQISEYTKVYLSISTSGSTSRSIREFLYRLKREYPKYNFNYLRTKAQIEEFENPKAIDNRAIAITDDIPKKIDAKASSKSTIGSNISLPTFELLKNWDRGQRDYKLGELYQNLAMDLNYIEKCGVEVFKTLFDNRPISRPIDWKGSQIQLRYFVKQLADNGIICKSNYVAITVRCFTCNREPLPRKTFKGNSKFTEVAVGPIDPIITTLLKGR